MVEISKSLKARQLEQDVKQREEDNKKEFVNKSKQLICPECHKPANNYEGRGLYCPHCGIYIPHSNVKQGD